MTTINMREHDFQLKGADGVVRTVNGVRLMTARRALEFEINTGMKLARGASANVVACKSLGLPKGTRKTKTLAVLKDVLGDAYGGAV